MKCQSPSILPEHVAIIMDGNNRWAKLHGYTSKEEEEHDDLQVS